MLSIKSNLLIEIKTKIVVNSWNGFRWIYHSRNYLRPSAMPCLYKSNIIPNTIFFMWVVTPIITALIEFKVMPFYGGSIILHSTSSLPQMQHRKSVTILSLFACFEELHSFFSSISSDRGHAKIQEFNHLHFLRIHNGR